MRRIWPAFLLALGGCYYLAQARGQIDILTGREPVDAVLASGKLGAADLGKLKLVAEAREFGERTVGLAKSDNYTTFYDTKGRPVSYVVSACRKDRFEAATWWFPIVGTLPYKGFFSLDDALAEARSLEAHGWDVSVRTVAAYSTLGWFSDPIFSTMLKNDDAELVALILHELTHGTVFATGHGDWNEALATFVGEEAARQFFRARFGEGSAELKEAEARFEDLARVDAFAGRVHGRLQKLYASGRPAEEILSLREQAWAEARDEFEAVRRTLRSRDWDGLYRGRINNAEVQAQRRYGRLEEFAKAFERAGRDWAAFWTKMREAAKAEDPFKAMEP